MKISIYSESKDFLGVGMKPENLEEVRILDLILRKYPVIFHLDIALHGLISKKVQSPGVSSLIVEFTKSNGTSRRKKLQRA